MATAAATPPPPPDALFPPYEPAHTPDLSLDVQDPEIGEQAVLEDVFSLFPRAGDVYAVTLTTGHLRYVSKSSSSSSASFSASLADVVGCICMRRKAATSKPTTEGDVGQVGSKKDGGGTAAFFGVYWYPLKKKKVGKGLVRKRTVLAFMVDKFGSYEENLALADCWRRAILDRLRLPKPNLPSKSKSNRENNLPHIR
jgi:hypothetical protein